jgi:DNA-binding Lrp family transcriptional regulator|tara:strand:- start:3 stop:254 length:252 start_codon:yes stop_codon:yes gene_type:complete
MASEAATKVAWVLIEVDPGMEREVYQQLLELENITETHIVFGPKDIVVKIEFLSEREMTETLIGKLRMVSGIKDTTTMIALEV